MREDEALVVSKTKPPIESETQKYEYFESDSIILESKLIHNNTSYTSFSASHKGDVLPYSGPLSHIVYLKDNIIIYEVQRGDTLESVSDIFNVSLESLKWANDVDNKIYEGQKLRVPPVSGVIHKINIDESVEFLAYLYGVETESIYRVNRVVYDGVEIVIPGARPVKSYEEPIRYRGVSLGGYFIMPTKGFNWGRIHYNNAVDIAGICETPIVAAADGVVIEEKEGGYNGGYGNYIIIEHSNEIKTLYAHNTENIVTVGDIVYQGEVISTIGSTGDVYGVTGCHLHFEVHGAENPFETK